MNSVNDYAGKSLIRVILYTGSVGVSGVVLYAGFATGNGTGIGLNAPIHKGMTIGPNSSIGIPVFASISTTGGYVHSTEEGSGSLIGEAGDRPYFGFLVKASAITRMEIYAI